jgi:hypothetical protein
VRKVSIREIIRPRCACGGDTRLKRVDQHPIYGIGFELRVFECERCRSERTTETSPDTISLVPAASPEARKSFWAMLKSR